MPKKKAASGGIALVPAAARPAAHPTRAADVDLDQLAEIVDREVTAFESLLGGRQALVSALFAGKPSAEIDAVLTFLADPKYDRWSIARICRRAQILPGQLFDAFRAAALSRAQILATLKAAERIDQVTQEVIDTALTHDEACRTCHGEKTVWVEIREKGKESFRKQEPCTTCNATGTIVVPGSLEHQRMSLELTGLLKKGGIAIQNNNVIPAGPTTLPGLEQLQQAVNDLVHGASAEPPADPEPAAPPVEGEVVP